MVSARLPIGILRQDAAFPDHNLLLVRCLDGEGHGIGLDEAPLPQGGELAATDLGWLVLNCGLDHLAELTVDIWGTDVSSPPQDSAGGWDEQVDVTFDAVGAKSLQLWALVDGAYGEQATVPTGSTLAARCRVRGRAAPPGEDSTETWSVQIWPTIRREGAGPVVLPVNEEPRWLRMSDPLWIQWLHDLGARSATLDVLNDSRFDADESFIAARAAERLGVPVEDLADQPLFTGPFGAHDGERLVAEQVVGLLLRRQGDVLPFLEGAGDIISTIDSRGVRRWSRRQPPRQTYEVLPRSCRLAWQMIIYRGNQRTERLIGQVKQALRGRDKIDAALSDWAAHAGYPLPETADILAWGVQRQDFLVTPPPREDLPGDTLLSISRYRRRKGEPAKGSQPNRFW